MVIKNDRIYIRITTQVKEDFEKVANYHGLKSATFLHSLMVKEINQMKKENPDLFKDSAETSDAPKVQVMTLDEAKADNKRKSKEK
jgi:hypothetical protein